jgi:outer membrane protein assembly factor BamD
MTMHLTRFLSGRVRAAAVILALAALAAACGPKYRTLPPGSTEPDKFLFEQGAESLARKRYLRAREYFRQIVDEYPQSRYRPDAKLGLGDTYVAENSVESLILATNEFSEFLTFYPTHERAHYAQYQLAISHYKQMLAPQRDQTQTKNAMKEFQAFVDRFPNSSLINQGQEKLQECHDRISDADYQVGYHYYRSRWYPGAISRFRAVLKDNPTYTRRDALYYYLADSYVRVGLTPEAPPLLDRLTKEFEQSEFLLKAEKMMADIKNGTIGTPAAADAKKGDAKKDAQPAEKKAEKK